MIRTFQVAPPLLLAAAAAALANLHAQGLGDAYPNLQRTLQLSNAQWDRVAGENNSFQAFVFEKSKRLTQIARELTIERLSPTPDPMALGVRHVEIATICRESSDRLATFRQALRNVLNPDQQTRLTQLEAAMASLPSISEGQAVRLLGTEVKSAAPPPVPGAPEGWRASKSVGELLPGCPVGNLGLVGVFALDGGSGFTLADRYPNLVRQLDLSGDQVQRMFELNTRFQETIGKRQTEAWQIRDAMEAESARPVPDAAVLGGKAARLEQLCRESLDGEAELRNSVRSLLSETQRPRWQDLDRALQLLPALAEAQDVNMNGRAPANPLPPPQLTGSAGLQRAYEWSVFFSGSQVFPGCDVIPVSTRSGTLSGSARSAAPTN